MRQDKGNKNGIEIGMRITHKIKRINVGWRQRKNDTEIKERRRNTNRKLQETEE